MPWLFARRQIAARWGCPPWLVDEAPDEEVALELRFGELEAECAPDKR